MASKLEAARLASLRGYRLLDTPPEAAFDAIAERAARELDAPIALVSLVDQDRQWFKAVVGLDIRETPRSMSFCAYAIDDSEVMIVPDTGEDARFRENPLVLGDPSIRFYAGAPLQGADGMRIGTLCVIDRKPREGLSPDARNLLQALADDVMRLIEARKAGTAAGA